MHDNASDDFFFLRISDHISISCLYAQLRTPDTSSKKETGAKNDRKESDDCDMTNESCRGIRTSVHVSIFYRVATKKFSADAEREGEKVSICR